VYHILAFVREENGVREMLAREWTARQGRDSKKAETAFDYTYRSSRNSGSKQHLKKALQEITFNAWPAPGKLLLSQ